MAGGRVFRHQILDESKLDATFSESVELISWRILSGEKDGLHELGYTLHLCSLLCPSIKDILLLREQCLAIRGPEILSQRNWLHLPPYEPLLSGASGQHLGQPESHPRGWPPSFIFLGAA